MAQVKDPVCGMTIDSATAEAQSSYQGQTYYFCSDTCKEQFEASPARFTSVTPERRPEERPTA